MLFNIPLNISPLFYRSPGLPLLEKAFETDNPELQKEALYSAGRIGEKAVPLLKRVLKNKDLDEDIRAGIEDLLEDF